MRKIHYLALILCLLLQKESNAASEFRCDVPHWMNAAESNSGVFHGDLELDCWANQKEELTNFGVLQKELIKKITSETIIHEGPISLSLNSMPTLKWDVTHQFKENGDSIKIREVITLSQRLNEELLYKTTSKEVDATGAASYLRSVNFSMKIERKKDLSTHIQFRNQVAVERPWYALDLIFAPIARKVCFEKMNQVREKFLPWLAAHSFMPEN